MANRNAYSLIAVGIGQWDLWTLPLIDSVRSWEPDVPFLVIDNGAETPYPIDGRVWQIRTKRTSYAAAINTGIRVCGPSAYYIIINNDVLCLAGFRDEVLQQPTDTICGNTLNYKFGRHWLDGWHYCIPHEIWEKVGGFDEAYEYAAFEDADYTFRCERAGFKVRQSAHPFIHLQGHIRHTLGDFKDWRRRNLDRLMRKYPEETHNWEPW